MNTYPHMCRMDHEEIGHRDSNNERCPVCRRDDEIETLKRTISRYIREQRRYEIARDVMAARTAAYALAFRFERSSEFKASAEEAVTAADALLKALEESSDGD